MAFKLAMGTPLTIRTPVGPVQAVAPGSYPDDLDTVRAVIGQASAFLAPFQAVFEIVEILQLVLDVVKAIPTAIATLSPGKITEPLQKLAGKVSIVAQFLPQLSFVRTAKDVVEVIDTSLRAVRALVEDLQLQESQKIAVENLVQILTNAGELQAATRLQVVADDLEELIADQNQALAVGNEGVDALIDVVNLILGLIPGDIPEIPTLGSLPSDLQAAIDLIDEILALLEPVRQALGPV